MKPKGDIQPFGILDMDSKLVTYGILYGIPQNPGRETRTRLKWPSLDFSHSSWCCSKSLACCTAALQDLSSPCPAPIRCHLLFPL